METRTKPDILPGGELRHQKRGELLEFYVLKYDESKKLKHIFARFNT
jgi:hypothetical protein